MTVIHLVRHGEVDNPDRILYLRLPGMYLSENGHRQAQCVARILKHRPIAAAYASPMPRAVQTADYIAYESGAVLNCSPFLNEIYSPYQGYPIEKIEQMKWDLYTGIAAPYETWDDVLARIRRFCDDMNKLYPDQEVAAVTHGDIVITAALWARGLPLTLKARQSIIYPGHASITTLMFVMPGSLPQWGYDDPFATPDHGG
jgi:broad specificity phosphatase PhoE